MQPIRQTRRDNCVAASVASVLGLPIEQFDSIRSDTWFEDLLRVLQPIGWTAIHVRFDEVNDQTRDLPRGYSLGYVPASASFGPDAQHCVVCLDGKIVWDPFRGERPGTDRSDEGDYVVLYPLDPAAGDNSNA